MFVDRQVLEAVLGKTNLDKYFTDGRNGVDEAGIMLVIKMANAYVRGALSPQYDFSKIDSSSLEYDYLQMAAVEAAKGFLFVRNPEFARRYSLGDTKQTMKLPFDLAKDFILMAKSGNALLSNAESVLENQVTELDSYQDKASIFASNDASFRGGFLWSALRYWRRNFGSTPRVKGSGRTVNQWLSSSL